MTVTAKTQIFGLTEARLVVDIAAARDLVQTLEQRAHERWHGGVGNEEVWSQLNRAYRDLDAALGAAMTVKEEA